MSWFGNLATKLQEVSDTVTEKAKNAIPLDHEMFEKMTLTTPELDAERKKFDMEEKRKEHIKDCLAGMLPWETRDPERDILVEECKEAILKLSDDAATFQGPYKMPGMTVKLEDDDAVDDEEGEDDEDDDEDEAKKDDEEKPSEESLDKLATLEPLPKLLDDFDLDAHVGLIQRLLSEDPSLVKMQSKLSGGGKREHYFWKNYFFHCAFARYEAGLTIDEIWNDEDPDTHKAKQDEDAAAAAAAAKKAAEEKTQAEATKPAAEEETITFDKEAAKGALNSAKEEAVAETPVESEHESAPTAEAQEVDEVVAATSGDGSPDASANTDFEQVGSDDNIPDDEDFGDDGYDFEMDELEAEIARELEG